MLFSSKAICMKNLYLFFDIFLNSKYVDFLTLFYKMVYYFLQVLAEGKQSEPAKSGVKTNDLNITILEYIDV